MTDLPDWELLGDALERVRAATGVSENEAKTRLCQAMAHGSVSVRFGRFESGPSDRFWGSPLATTNRGSIMHLAMLNFFISPHLSPEDLDWVHSRPLNLSIGPTGGLIGSWADPPLLVLSIYDVDQVLCAGVRESAEKKKAQTATATDEEEERATSALAEYLKSMNLKSNRDLPTREDATAWLCKNGFDPKPRAFQNRIWPNALREAGFPPKAPSGRKKESSR
jgi:hypothetical protein